MADSTFWEGQKPAGYEVADSSQELARLGFRYSVIEVKRNGTRGVVAAFVYEMDARGFIKAQNRRWGFDEVSR